MTACGIFAAAESGSEVVEAAATGKTKLLEKFVLEEHTDLNGVELN